MSEQMEQGGTPARNTKSRAWCLTINNYCPLDIEKLQQCENYTFQEETGTEGTPHLQCVIKFKNPRSFGGIKKLFPTAHIERCQNINASINYCTKKETRTGEMYTNMIKTPKPLIDFLDGHEYYDWQNEFFDLINQPINNRKIYWYWSYDGAKGKSSSVRHMLIKHPGKVLVVGGASKDIYHGITSFLENDDNDLQMLIVDLPRNANAICYAALESVSNGYFFTTKYESKMMVFNPPHIVVFTNKPPERGNTVLSDDRYVEYNLD